MRQPQFILTTRFTLGVAALLLVMKSNAALVAQPQVKLLPVPTVNPLGWKFGDGVHIRMKTKPPGDTGEWQDAYDMHIIIGPGEKVGDITCWRLEMIPIILPRTNFDGHRALIEPDLGEVVRLAPRKNLIAPEAIKRVEGLVISPEPFGAYPFEVLPLMKVGESRSRDGKYIMRLGKKREGVGDTSVWEAVITRPEGGALTITQKWVDGEKWWREYERTDNGEVTLSAEIVIPKVYPRVEMPKDDLRADRRLNAKVSIVGDNPPRAEVFEKLSKATGLRITWAANLDHLKPKYGGVQWPSISAFAVMNHFKDFDVTGAKWVKVGDEGYRLEGKPKYPPPPVQTVQQPEAASPVSESQGAAPPKGRSWLTILIASSIGIVIGAAGILLWRQRAGKAR